MTVNVFAVPGKLTDSFGLGRNEDNADAPGHCQVFFICFRETLETSIIVSVLLAFLKQTLGHDSDPLTYKKLRRQVSLCHARYPSSLAPFPADSNPGMAWHYSGFGHLHRHRCGPDRSLLRPGQRQVVRHRRHLGGILQHLRIPRHLHHGCCPPPRVQTSGQVAGQARQSAPSQGQYQAA